MKFQVKRSCYLLLAIIFLVSCSSDDDGNNNSGGTFTIKTANYNLDAGYQGTSTVENGITIQSLALIENRIGYSNQSFTGSSNIVGIKLYAAQSEGIKEGTYDISTINKMDGNAQVSFRVEYNFQTEQSAISGDITDGTLTVVKQGNGYRMNISNGTTGNDENFTLSFAGNFTIANIPQ